MTAKVSKESVDVVEEKIKILKKVIPECFSESKLDFEKLRKTLGQTLDSNDEKYSFSWAGRNDTFKNIQVPSKGTLIPLSTESIDFEKTENLFIEGDSLEILKLLQKSYFEKIKMIYIDPPYNTGKDFIYKDNFHDNIKAYLEQTGQVEGGIRLTTNPETSGRFHSDWISMMYSRVFLARTLLSEDGFIFVSIDDVEVHNLRMIMNEIFGEENFIADLTIVNNLAGRSDKKYIANAHEHILMYHKSDLSEIVGLPLTPEMLEEYDQEDKKGRFRFGGLRKRGANSRRQDRPNLYYPIYVDPIDKTVSTEKSKKHHIEVYPKLSNGEDGCWRWEKLSVKERKDELVAKLVAGRNEWDIFQKDYLFKNGEERRMKLKSFLLDSDYSTDTATTVLREIFDGKKIFDNPKSPWLLKDLISYVTKPNDIILDFFAGSATTAHAVLDLNKTSNGGRKFICTQLQEQIDSGENAYKEGYRTISEIAKERIKRVIKNIKHENTSKLIQKKLDLGFKVFKLAKSNFEIWENYEGKDTKKLKDQMKLFQSPLVAGAKDLDVIYECIIKEGFSLNSKIEKMNIKANTIYKISDADSFFYITLDKVIKDEIIDKLDLTKDDMFICIDAALNDSKKTNLSKQCNLKTL